VKTNTGNRFYVYALLVGSSVESLTPFYIGKGCGKRLNHHFKPWSLKSKSYKNNKIKAAIASGLILQAVKLWDNLLEDKALETEQKEIAWFNSTSIKLCNVYDGGLAKSYDKNLKKIEPIELDRLIKSFLAKPGITLLQDWIKHVSHVYSVGSAKNIYRGEVYASLRQKYPGFGGKMTEEQTVEYQARLSARVSGSKNPAYLPKLNISQMLLAKMLSPIQTVVGVCKYISGLGYAKPAQNQKPLISFFKPPKVKVIKPPKVKVIKPPKVKAIKPPELKIAYSTFERQQIMQMYLVALKAEPLRMSPSIFVKEYLLIVGYGALVSWFKRSGAYMPRAIGNKSNGGRATAIKTRRPVQQYKDGKLVAKFDSCTQAAALLGYSQGNIRNVCEGTWAQAYGFQWKYSGAKPLPETTE
jgi:hypothetical protein